MIPFPGTLDRSGIGGKIMLTDEQLAWMTQYFPKIENSRLMEASGLTHSTLHRIARSYHLTKSVSGLRAIKRRQAKHIKQVCEANGYYDSLRGKPVSEACREGTRRLWASGFHPTKNMSKRRYQQYIQRKSESRKELWRQERFRQQYGLARQTNLQMPEVNFTKRQICHRYNAQQRGYIITECSRRQDSPYRFVIFYDDDTERSEKFERNLIKDGFEPREWTND